MQHVLLPAAADWAQEVVTSAVLFVLTACCRGCGTCYAIRSEASGAGHTCMLLPQTWAVGVGGAEGSRWLEVCASCGHLASVAVAVDVV